MKLKTGILVIFLVFGLLGVPNCIFAQDYDYSSNAVLESSIPILTQTNGLNVQVKGSSGGKGGFSSSKSVSKTVKKLDGDDDDTSSDDGSGWTIAIIILVILGIIGILVWYFFLRK